MAGLRLARSTNLRRVLKIMLDPDEFLCDHGIRSISKRHERDPYRFVHNQQEFVVQYLPAESDSGLFGGNSNWRGPIWMPVNVMINHNSAHLFDQTNKNGRNHRFN